MWSAEIGRRSALVPERTATLRMLSAKAVAVAVVAQLVAVAHLQMSDGVACTISYVGAYIDMSMVPPSSVESLSMGTASHWGSGQA